MVVKLLGELEDLGPRSLDSAIAVAPPIDLVHCCRHLRSGLNRIYDWTFVRSLHALVQERRRKVPDLHDLPLRALPRRLREFDHEYTAPLIGYSGAMEYYAKASAAPYLAHIRRPTLIVTAADDPIIPVNMFSRYDMSPQVKLHVTEHGGHLGWVGVSGVDPDRRWLDWRIVDWIMKLGVCPVCPAGRNDQNQRAGGLPGSGSSLPAKGRGHVPDAAASESAPDRRTSCLPGGT
jgi:hypothetical protein